MPCEHKGTGQGAVSTSQGKPKMPVNHGKLSERAGTDSCLTPSEGALIT